jgi:lipoate-protein ligase A
MPTEWRLLMSPPATGRRNMAVDEAILAAVTAGHAPPTLRLYAWDPPCLSLGHAQSAEVVDAEALADAGWDVVRRPTGGRALLHTDEVTYSIAGLETTSGLAGGVLPSYRQLSRGLLAGLTRLGLHRSPALAVRGEVDRLNPVCFESARTRSPSAGKTDQGAQCAGGSVLQHGSMPLCGDLTTSFRAAVPRRTRAARRPGAYCSTPRR